MYICLVFDQLNNLELMKAGVCPVVLFEMTEVAFKKKKHKPQNAKIYYKNMLLNVDTAEEFKGMLILRRFGLLLLPALLVTVEGKPVSRFWSGC